MENDLIHKIRDFVYNASIERLDLNLIAHNIGVKMSELLLHYPSPQSLAEALLNQDKEELDMLLDTESFAKEGAIDSIILASIAVYHSFENITPSRLVFLSSLYPDLFNEALEKKIELIKQHFYNNINKGIEKGEYNDHFDKNAVINKYCKRIEQLYLGSGIGSKNYTFGHIFNIIFEDYIEEVATKENWHYFRNRKQLVEILNFGK